MSLDPNSSFAEGFVAFLAISYISSGIARSTKRSKLNVRILLVILLFFSEFLIRARTDIALSLVSASILAWRKNSISMLIVSITIPLCLLFVTFTSKSYYNDESLRAELIVRGFSDSLHHVMFGDGSRYRATADLMGNFQSLSVAGVTESGILDFMIAYGAPATIFLSASVFFALGAQRYRNNVACVVLACTFGSLAISGSIASYVGAIVLYCSLIICQGEERYC